MMSHTTIDSTTTPKTATSSSTTPPLSATTAAAAAIARPTQPEQQQQPNEQSGEMKLIPHCRLAEIWAHYNRQLSNLDDLEKRLNEQATRCRRRIASVMDQTPTYRRSHLRLFVTHSLDPNNHLWTLVIEGKLLVGLLDHKSAAMVDAEGVPASVWSSTTNTTTNTTTTNPALPVIAALDQPRSSTTSSAVTVPGNPSPTVATATTATTTSTTAQSNVLETSGATAVRSTDKSQYRTVGEKEEDPIEPTLFTHCFDKLVVNFQTIYQPTVHPNAAAATSHNANTYNTPKKKTARSAKRKASHHETKEVVAGPIHPRHLKKSPHVTTITWRKQDSPDAHAFQVQYQESQQLLAPPFKDMKVHSVVATITLYSTRPEPLYKPCPALVESFFPNHATKKVLTPGQQQQHQQEQQKQSPPPTRNTSSLYKKRKGNQDEFKATATNASQESNNNTNNTNTNTNNKTTTTNHRNNTVIPLDNDIHCPSFLTMNEISMALLTYIQDHQLSDTSDRSFIHCDKVLSNILDCESFHFSQLEDLLLTKNLITQLKDDDDPIVLTYIMTETTVSPQQPEGQSSRQKEPGEEPSTSCATGTIDAITPTNTNTSTTAGSDEAISTAMTTKQHLQPSILSFDMDVMIPSFFHYRARELMRRIKRREFEYTSSRTKARYLLVASRGNEDRIKTKIEQVVSGRGYAAENIPIYLALAKAAPPHSEARASAQTDAKICSLLERLDECSRGAELAWEFIALLRGMMHSQTK